MKTHFQLIVISSYWHLERLSLTIYRSKLFEEMLQTEGKHKYFKHHAPSVGQASIHTTRREQKGSEFLRYKNFGLSYPK